MSDGMLGPIDVEALRKRLLAAQKANETGTNLTTNDEAGRIIVALGWCIKALSGLNFTGMDRQDIETVKNLCYALYGDQQPDYHKAPPTPPTGTTPISTLH